MTKNYLKMLKKIEKVQIFLDLDTLDMYVNYLRNEDTHKITFSNLANLKEYVDMMDPKVFQSNDALMVRYEFIRLYLEARLESGITKSHLCMRYVIENIDHKYKKELYRAVINNDPDEMSSTDIEFINDLIFAQLNTQFMHRYKVGMTQIIEDLNDNEFSRNTGDCESAIEFFQTMLTDLQKAQRRSKQDNRFSLSDTTHYQAIMTEAIDRLLSGDSFWQTGWVGMNRMLEGGFENGRVYNFIGATGGFKSGLLLNIMKTVKKNNVGHVHKDMSKRPTILVVSQENNIWETISRIFGIYGTGARIKGYNAKDAMNVLMSGGFRIEHPETLDEIDIEIRYHGNMDVGVADIQGMVEEIGCTGREVVLIIQDYIERLRPTNMNQDRRLQLGDVSNQLHDLAMALDVPIITASQYNRMGVNQIEEYRNKEHADIGKSVGMGSISESYGMLKNFDANIGIVLEYVKKEHRYYLSFNLLKYRGDDSDAIKYFAQPFVGQDSKIQLVEDIGLEEPLFRTSLMDEQYANLEDSRKKMRSTVRNGITSATPEMEEQMNMMNMVQPQPVGRQNMESRNIPDIEHQYSEDIPEESELGRMDPQSGRRWLMSPEEWASRASYCDQNDIDFQDAIISFWEHDQRAYQEVNKAYRALRGKDLIPINPGIGFMKLKPKNGRDIGIDMNLDTIRNIFSNHSSDTIIGEDFDHMYRGKRKEQLLA